MDFDARLLCEAVRQEVAKIRPCLLTRLTIKITGLEIFLEGIAFSWYEKQVALEATKRIISLYIEENHASNCKTNGCMTINTSGLVVAEAMENFLLPTHRNETDR